MLSKIDLSGTTTSNHFFKLQLIEINDDLLAVGDYLL